MFSIYANGCNKWYPEWVSNIQPFINKYKWKGINYPLKIDDLKTFEKHTQLIFQKLIGIATKKKFFNDSKWTKRRKTIYIINHNIKTPCGFLLFKFSSSF